MRKGRSSLIIVVTAEGFGQFDRKDTIPFSISLGDKIPTWSYIFLLHSLLISELLLMTLNKCSLLKAAYCKLWQGV